ncbi:MAG: secondary thiamine-phosphate synthase enzyme YjbQ [Candidatus Thorarchaeota archaeon]
MTVYTSEMKVETNGEPSIIDVTNLVTQHVERSTIRSGLVTVFCTGSTAAITTIEYEPGLLKDLPAAMERFAPRDAVYEHHLRWQDGNGHSHVRAAIIGPSLTIPIIDGKMPLGTWQQIALLELDIRPRTRQLIIQVIGDQ